MLPARKHTRTRTHHARAHPQTYTNEPYTVDTPARQRLLPAAGRMPPRAGTRPTRTRALCATGPRAKPRTVDVDRRAVVPTAVFGVGAVPAVVGSAHLPPQTPAGTNKNMHVTAVLARNPTRPQPNTSATQRPKRLGHKVCLGCRAVFAISSTPPRQRRTWVSVPRAALPEGWEVP